MEIDLITTSDLRKVKNELIEELKNLIHLRNHQFKWLRSQDVQELLNISAGTLHNLREKKLLPYARVSGIIFYEYDDIIELLRKNKIK